MYYFARHGVVGVNIGYRLAPEAKFPDSSKDVGSALDWLRANATTLHVDPGQIFLLGHSAGAAHAASYAYDPGVHPSGGPGLRGLIIVSGRVRADSLPQNPNAKRVAAYYGEGADYERCSPISHIIAASVPTLVAMSEFENPMLDVYCCELAYRLAKAKNRAPHIVRIKGHNHSSIMTHFNTEDDRLGREILDFINDPK
jgi:acetyl esterase/lipase